MKSKKGGNFWKKKTLKERLRQRIGEKDICCETNFNRDIIIQMIMDNYKKYASNYVNKDEYLNSISNDLVIFIGYKVDLVNDKNGAALWDELDKELGGNKTNFTNIQKVLREVPLSFLLAFLGLSAYKLEILKSSSTL